MSKAIALSDSTKYERNTPAIGVFVAGDPRIDAESRQRCVNICKMVADTLAARVKLPDGSPAKVVWAPTLVDGEAQADLVAKQFQDAGVKVLVCAPDTWAFPQLSVISLLQQFPADTPINFTCGNSGPKPGVVFAHAVNGAIAQYGRLTHLNVGTWPDTGLNPVMTEGTAQTRWWTGPPRPSPRRRSRAAASSSSATTRWAWRPRWRTSSRRASSSASRSPGWT